MRGLVLLVLTLLAIAALTLWPASGDPVPWSGGCVVCSVHGTADLLLNIVLFMPLGASLALVLCRHPVARSLVYGALLSTSIEVAQLFIPGRDSSYGDIGANTLGAAVGAFLAVTWRTWLLPSDARAARLSQVAALLVAGICFVEGLLFTPAFPAGRYFGMWTPNLGHLTWYRGRVHDVTLSGQRIEHGWIADPARVRAVLGGAEGAFRLEVRARAGPPPDGVAPLFAIYDDRRREIVLLGADGADLVFRIRTLAAQLRLDGPDLRVVNGLAGVRNGDSLRLTAAGSGGRGRYELMMNADPPRRTGYSVGNGWGLLMYPEFLPPWVRTLADLCWVAALFAPAGVWLRSRAGMATAGGAMVAGLLVAPALTPLVSTPAGQWAAAAAGVLAGVGLHRVMSRRLAAQDTGRRPG